MEPTNLTGRAPTIVLVSREVYPLNAAGLGAYVASTAEALAAVAEVTIITSSSLEPLHATLRAAGDPRLPAGVRFAFAAEPAADHAQTPAELHRRWSASAHETLVSLFPGPGPDLVEFPDFHGEGAATIQARRTASGPFANTLVLVRAHSTSEMCAVLNGYLPTNDAHQGLFDLERYALRYADRFVYAGGDIEQTFRRFYGTDGIASGVRVRHAIGLTACADEPLPDGAFALIYLGRLERRKGVHNLISAVVGLDRDDVSLTVVGGDTDTGSLGYSLAGQLRELVGDDPRVTFRPPVSRVEVPSLIASHHAAVMPSLWECWPNVALEALLANRPVIATPTGGYTEIVRPGRSGWLTEDVSARSLAAVIDGLARDRMPLLDLVESEGPRRSLDDLTDVESIRDSYLRLVGEARAQRSHDRPRARPLVSLVLPVDEATTGLDATLASIADQTYTPIETVVVIDGPGRELPQHPNLRIVRQHHAGLGAAKNLGAEASQGAFLLALSPGVVIGSRLVERCVEALEADPESDAVTAWTGEGVPASIVVLRRGAFERGARWSDELAGSVDAELAEALRQAGGLRHAVPEVLVHGGSGQLPDAVAMRLEGEIAARLREREVQWTITAAVPDPVETAFVERPRAVRGLAISALVASSARSALPPIDRPNHELLEAELRLARERQAMSDDHIANLEIAVAHLQRGSIPLASPIARSLRSRVSSRRAR